MTLEALARFCVGCSRPPLTRRLSCVIGASSVFGQSSGRSAQGSRPITASEPFLYSPVLQRNFLTPRQFSPFSSSEKLDGPPFLPDGVHSPRLCREIDRFWDLTPRADFRFSIFQYFSYFSCTFVPLILSNSSDLVLSLRCLARVLLSPFLPSFC